MKSLNNKIVLLISLSVIFTVLLVATVGLVFFNELIVRSSEEIMMLTCDNKTQQMNSWFSSIEQSVNLFHDYCEKIMPSDENLLRDIDYMTAHVENVSNLLEDTAFNTEYAATMFYRFDPSFLPGDFGLFLVKHKNGSIVRFEPTDLNLYTKNDEGRTLWWFEPIENKKPTWILPYYNINITSEIISYVIPIYVNEKPFGVIGMDIEFSKLQEMVNSVNLQTKTHAMLITKTGDLLYSKHNYPDEYSDELAEIIKNIATEGTAENQKLQSYSFLGKKHQFAHRTLKNGMLLVVAVPYNELHESKYMLGIQSLIVIVIGLLISVVISANITKKLTYSLRKLTQSAEQLGKGNYKLDIEINEKDEIGILSKTLKEAAIEIEKSNHQINMLAYIDSLTGTKNRHCFNRFIGNLNGLIQKNVGTIFCDLNGLKYTNDNFGHEAGDKMICDFSEILKTVFPGDEVFRLSGDEFIVLALGKTREDFYKDIENLKYYNEKKEFPFAGIGYVWTCETDNLVETINRAEEEMYKQKAEIYKKFPQYKR